MYNDAEAERALISAVLQDNTVYDAVSVGAAHLYSEKNRKLWTAIGGLLSDGHTVDYITLTKAMTGQIESPASYVSAFDLPTAGNYEFYEKQVLDAYKRRVFHKLQVELKQAIENPVEDILALTEEKLQEIYDTSAKETHYIRDGLKATIDTIEQRTKTKGFTGVPCGIDGIDELTNGFQAGEFIIIGARPSVGKTALALTMLADIADSRPCVLYSLEMSEKAISERLVSMVGSLHGMAVRTGTLSDSDFSALTTAAERIWDSKFLINDSPMTIGKLTSDIRYSVRKHGAQIVFIDYISLITHPDKTLKRHEQVSDFSRELKRVAKDANIPVVVLSQVRRETEGRAPALSDLRESGSLEQDADLVIFLHREEEDTECLVAKHRNGPTGKFHLRFVPQYGKFVRA